MPCSAWGGIELINLYGSFGEFRQDFEFPAERLDDLSQRGNLHIRLPLQFREARLLDAERFRHLLLALARKLPDFAKQQFRQQLLRAPSGPHLRPFRARPSHEFVERFCHNSRAPEWVPLSRRGRGGRDEMATGDSQEPLVPAATR